MNKKQKKVLYRIIITFVIVISLSILKVEFPFSLLYLIPYFIIGNDILKKALKGIKNKQIFDENFLMAVATVGAILLGDFREGVAVMLFYQIGELFQSYAVGKSRRNISDLMDIRPDSANLLTDGSVSVVDPDEVPVGATILVKPGEKIPIDGVVLKGSTSIDTKALTGESVPRTVHEGDSVISGCINNTSVIEIVTTKEAGESTVSKILEMVENASQLKSKSENFISKFAKFYTPIVCHLALALAIVPPVIIIFAGYMGEMTVLQVFGTWVYRALTFLVISCPCALVISIPLTFFAGIGSASAKGILIKGSSFLEALSNVKIVAMDKTGTLTKGVFEVTKIHAEAGFTEEEILEYAAIVENNSNHPIAKSIMAKFGKEIPANASSETTDISGYGLCTVTDSKKIYIGNKKLMDLKGVKFTECPDAGTICYLAVNEKYAGYILISDIVKPNAKAAIRAMHDVGIRNTVMLTGDNKSVACKVAEELQIKTVKAELLPADKVTVLEELIEGKKKGENVAFVGDGINDAPVLSRADLGIAMGALGSDAAIEAADIVLMDDDPVKISLAIKLSRKCMAIVYQNIYFAIGIKVLCLVLGALGIANMWIAIFADVGVMIIAVLNAVRVLLEK